jgi:phasin family protein
MVKNFEEFQQASKENIDLAMKSVNSVSKSAQAIAAEIADYSKKSFEESTALMEKLFGAKSFEKAIEVQTEYAKAAYEGLVAETSKLGEMYSALAKETYKPFESMIAKAK